MDKPPKSLTKDEVGALIKFRRWMPKDIENIDDKSQMQQNAAKRSIGPHDTGTR